MTATQPPFENEIKNELDHFALAQLDMADQPHLTNDYSSEQVFNRVNMINLGLKQKYWTMEQLAKQILEVFSKYQSGLVILNTRRMAEQLYYYLSEYSLDKLDDKDLYLLSNNLVPIHRKQRIVEIKSRLENNEHILVISTSLVEAGVDLSFEFVFKALSGLDSVIQAAGRCNRNGEFVKGVFFVFEPSKTWKRGLEDHILQSSFNLTRSLLKNNVSNLMNKDVMETNLLSIHCKSTL